MGVAGQGFQITNAIEAGASFKGVGEGEGREHCIAPGTAAANQAALWVDLLLRCQIVDGLLGVLYIFNAPGVGKSLPVVTTKAGAAPVVNIDNGKAAVSPVLNFQV